MLAILILVMCVALNGLIFFGATVLANTGKAIICNRIKGSGTEPVYAHWGTGAGTSAITDTGLFTPSADEARVAGTTTIITTTTTNDTYKNVATITCATAGKTITNAGLFDDITAGSLFMAGNFTGVVLAVGDAIQFTMTVQFT